MSWKIQMSNSFLQSIVPERKILCEAYFSTQLFKVKYKKHSFICENMPLVIHSTSECCVWTKKEKSFFFLWNILIGKWFQVSFLLFSSLVFYFVGTSFLRILHNLGLNLFLVIFCEFCPWHTQKLFSFCPVYHVNTILV